mmetsp:Transcript_18603/g.47884  ORF Transcript_18603/g.47884 Transcript_18603/m.47884 type:complete len:342 (+) Transcript_18603:1728-2753(+)
MHGAVRDGRAPLPLHQAPGVQDAVAAHPVHAHDQLPRARHAHRPRGRVRHGVEHRRAQAGAHQADGRRVCALARTRRAPPVQAEQCGPDALARHLPRGHVPVPRRGAAGVVRAARVRRAHAQDGVQGAGGHLRRHGAAGLPERPPGVGLSARPLQRGRVQLERRGADRAVHHHHLDRLGAPRCGQLPAVRADGLRPQHATVDVQVPAAQGAGAERGRGALVHVHAPRVGRAGGRHLDPLRVRLAVADAQPARLRRPLPGALLGGAAARRGALALAHHGRARGRGEAARAHDELRLQSAIRRARPVQHPDLRRDLNRLMLARCTLHTHAHADARSRPRARAA